MTEKEKQEVKHMIDEAISTHNRNASLISMILGIIILAAFLDGFFRLAGLISPFLGLDVSIL